ncbi:MAG: substrate-binding domain-containing protein [Clostridia bacterium]|nr:substrate-binding domain-containing protein [Clostridia bacterium]
MRKITGKLTLVWTIIFSLLLTMSFNAAAFSAPAAKKVPAKKVLKIEPEVVLATTTSTQDSGLLDVMIPAFEKKWNKKVKVKVIAVGTGQAIQLGKDGNADVILVHSKKSEDEFVAQGYGFKAYDVMYNQYLIVGPTNDPANIAGAKTALEAFTKIAEAKGKFISRGDDSGTHKKEVSIWGKAKIKPEGNWYLSAGQGMGETLRMADEMGAYTLVDEATFLTNKTSLKNLSQGDKELFNQYGIIQVKSTKKPVAANELIWHFISPQGQKTIKDFGKNKYGKSIFVPNAKKR